MRRLVLLGTLIVLSGCQSVLGPFRPKPPQRVDDPSVTIREQESRERARYALPDEAIAPNAGNYIPVPGRTTIDR